MLMTREQAKELNLSRYLGVPCKHGHDGWRLKTGHCVTCVELARSAPEKREKARQRAATWYADNKERAAEAQKDYRKHHPGYDTKSKKGWKKRNPGKVNANTAARRIARMNATLPGHAEKLEQIYANCPKDQEVDHIFPLRHPLCCGLHVPWNLQYLAGPANKQKSNKLPELSPSRVLL